MTCSKILKYNQEILQQLSSTSTCCSKLVECCRLSLPKGIPASGTLTKGDIKYNILCTVLLRCVQQMRNIPISGDPKRNQFYFVLPTSAISVVFFGKSEFLTLFSGGYTDSVNNMQVTILPDKRNLLILDKKPREIVFYIYQYARVSKFS